MRNGRTSFIQALRPTFTQAFRPDLPKADLPKKHFLVEILPELWYTLIWVIVTRGSSENAPAAP